MLTGNEKLYQEFKAVFEQYYQPLCNYAFNFLKDKDACEDIVQEIFLRIWEKKKNLIHSKEIRYYMFTAVRNNCLSFIENKKKSSALFTEDMGATLYQLPQDDKEAGPTDSLELIKKSLSLLPPRCKDVFLLSRIGKLSYKEIAAATGVSVKTVENQIGKALKILKEFIKEHKVFSFLPGILFISGLNQNGIGDFIKLLFS
ncbi:MAG: RNA polymerase sigma-70 factor [Bacteroidetes bacterium]|nr:RNA polymerase sigma-70 factor [Bacteroidota bacterium]MBS1932459.1 RNA polymerase sigma-70 factor [Bacteroidota bacterium]